MVTRMKLHGHGRVEWARASALLTGTECAWTDMSGAHHGAHPERRPIGAGHLWAWDARRCLRLRFDDDAVYIGELREAGAGKPVEVTVRTGVRLWHPGDMRAGPIPEEMRSGEWELLEITGEHPTTFVRRRS